MLMYSLHMCMCCAVRFHNVTGVLRNGTVGLAGHQCKNPFKGRFAGMNLAVNC